MKICLIINEPDRTMQGMTCSVEEYEMPKELEERIEFLMGCSMAGYSLGINYDKSQNKEKGK